MTDSSDSNRSQWKTDTLLVHNLVPPKALYGAPISPPLVHSSSFAFDSTNDLESTITQPGSGYVYSRVHNPTTETLNQSIAELEGAEKALAFGSGMAAIHAALVANCQTGDHIVAPASVYGGAYALMTGLLKKFGIETTFVEEYSADSFAKAVRPNTRIIYAETISNPLLHVPNLSKLADVAHANNALLIVDSTLATPITKKPIQHGANIVVHSATKYMGGHGDLLGGLIAGKDWLIRKIQGTMIDSGSIISPTMAWLMLRGMKTLGLRVQKHNENALAVARFLDQHPKVKICHYPGLTHHPDHEYATQTLSDGYGGVVAFEIHGDDQAASKVADSLKLFLIAPSLGDAHSLVLQPAMTSHRPLSKEARLKAGITEGFIRLSIGIENSQDLIHDLDRALTKI